MALLPGAAKNLGRSLLTKSLRGIGASGEPLLALSSLVLQGWAFRDARKQMDATLGEQGGWEAKLPVVSATLGFIGASFELTGATLKAFGATVGEKLIKAGAALGALSLLVDGIQAAFSAVRAFRQGESKAGWAYAGAAATFVAGAAIGFLTGFSSALTGAFILGPLGWILLLTAIGIGLIWYAVNACLLYTSDAADELRGV